MIRIHDKAAALDFFCNTLGMVEVHSYDSEEGKYTNIFLAAPGDVEAARTSRAPLLDSHTIGQTRKERLRNILVDETSAI